MTEYDVYDGTPCSYDNHESICIQGECVVSTGLEMNFLTRLQNLGSASKIYSLKFRLKPSYKLKSLSQKIACGILCVPERKGTGESAAISKNVSAMLPILFLI